MKIAIVSLDQIWEDKAANQQKCLVYIEKASKFGAEMIAFPEMTLTGFSMNTGMIAEKPEQSETIDFFRRQALVFNIAVAFGVVFLNGDKATNNLIVIDKNGTLLSSYAKIHPFSFSGESNFYTGGNQISFCEISDAMIGLAVCYDLRFPEIFQFMSSKCNLILIIANWPETRIKHWNILLQARAIENQCFIVGVNRTGTDHNNQFYVKSSIIFDPNGNEVKDFKSFEVMDIYDINPTQVSLTRNSFPLKNDRRSDFYKTLL